MDRAAALAKLPQHLHATADEMASKMTASVGAVDWTKILAALQAFAQFLPVILAIFGKPTPAASFSTTGGTKCECPDHVLQAAEDAVQANLQALASAVCVKHCLECCNE